MRGQPPIPSNIQRNSQLFEISDLHPEIQQKNTTQIHQFWIQSLDDMFHTVI